VCVHGWNSHFQYLFPYLRDEFSFKTPPELWPRLLPDQYIVAMVRTIGFVASVVCAGALRGGQPTNSLETTREKVISSQVFQQKVQQSCARAPAEQQVNCQNTASGLLFCQLVSRSKPEIAAEANCTKTDVVHEAPAATAPSFAQTFMEKAPEDELAQEMTHDLEMNFNKIAPFGKEDTAKELQDHAAKTQDTLVDAVENAEVAEIKRAVFRALTRLRAATIKEFDTIARLETQAIDAYNDAHHYRAENPLTHLHEDEAPVETDKLKSFH